MYFRFFTTLLPKFFFYSVRELIIEISNRFLTRLILVFHLLKRDFILFIILRYSGGKIEKILLRIEWRGSKYTFICTLDENSNR